MHEGCTGNGCNEGCNRSCISPSVMVRRHVVRVFADSPHPGSGSASVSSLWGVDVTSQRPSIPDISKGVTVPLSGSTCLACKCQLVLERW